MKKARNRDERTRLEEEIRKPIRPRVIRPHGFAVPNDREAIKRENKLMEELHERAIVEKRRDKLKLLCRRYSLAEDDYRGLARKLRNDHEPRSALRALRRRYSVAEDDHEGLALHIATQHEPGFRVVNRQLAKLNFDFSGRSTKSTSIVSARIKKGALSYGRGPVDWPPEKLLELLEAVQIEKKRTGVRKDLDALTRLAKGKAWGRPATKRSRSPRGDLDAWVRTLQSRLHDAKKFKSILDAANDVLKEAARLVEEDECRTRK